MQGALTIAALGQVAFTLAYGVIDPSAYFLPVIVVAVAGLALDWFLPTQAAGFVFAGVAGCFFAAKMTAISPDSFQFMQSATILMAVVLGGMGKIPGMVVGALSLVLFPEVFREIGSMRMLVFGVVLIAMMIFRPQGIWPERRN